MVDFSANARLYLTNDSSASIENISAEDWARSQWFPSLFLILVVAFLAQFLIAYEHVVHFPIEVAIWRRIFRKQTRTKARLAWLTIWLRYTTLAFGIMLIIVMWDRATLDTCRNKIFPTAFAFAVVVSISTGYVNTCRTRTIAKAALSSRSTFNLVQMICLLCLLSRFASLVVAFSLQIQVTKAIEARANLDEILLPESCFARATPIMDTVASRRVAPIRSLYALLSIFTGIDSIVAGITFYSIAKLRKSVLNQNHLLDELFRNSIQYFSVLIVIDLFCLIFLCVTKQANVLALVITGGAIVTIRILIKEQECIIAHSRTLEAATRTIWPACGEKEEEAGHENVSRRGAILGKGFEGVPVLQSRFGQCSGCHQDKNAQQIKRRGAGLTDIEKVTIVEHARSIDGPWATLSSDDRDREKRSKVAAWTRQTACVMIDEDIKDSTKDKRSSLRLLKDTRHRFSFQGERSISPLLHIGRVMHPQTARSHSTRRNADNVPRDEMDRTCKTIF